MNKHQEVLGHLWNCKDCYARIYKFIARDMTRHAGSTTSEAKAKSSRENGKLGGRPRKKL